MTAVVNPYPHAESVRKSAQSSYFCQWDDTPLSDCKSRKDLDPVEHDIGGGFHQSGAWLGAWRAHYGSDLPRRALVVRDESGRVLASLELIITSIGIGLRRFTVAKIAGMDRVMAVGEPAVSEAACAIVLDALRDRLLCEGECDAIVLSLVPDTHPVALFLRHGGSPEGISVAFMTESDSRSMLTLSRVEEGIPFEISRDERKALRRRERRFADEQAGLIEVLTRTEDASREFDAFVSQHAAQWRAKGRGGHFADWPGISAFHRSLIQSGDGAVVLVRVRSSSGVAAYQYGAICGQTAYAMLSARANDPRFDRYSPGHLALIGLARHAAALGCTRLDLGRGTYAYKNRLGARRETLTTYVLTLDNANARRRGRMLGYSAQIIHVLQYRLWFCRVSPRLGLGMRPLPSLWLRTRL